jgi:hypothetical protein
VTWSPITQAEMTMARHVVTWISTVRAAGGVYGADWLPSDADMSKSALLERLRSGKEPLAEAPPLGYSCPWYAVVEDPGPHYVFDAWRGQNNEMVVLQSAYEIVEERSGYDMIVRDKWKNTSYRFHLWYDAEWEHPSKRLAKGGWFMQNVALATSPLTSKDSQ